MDLKSQNSNNVSKSHKLARNQSILVTGGAGFLGSHLCEALLKMGQSVTCLDDLSTGTLSNIYKIIRDRKFKFQKGNVQNAIDMDVDFIFNLACPASPVAYQKDPISTIQTAFLGMNMLHLAKCNGATVFQASTSEVYGDAKVHPQTELYWGNVNPIGIRACYDEGKRCAETLCFDYNRQYSVDVRVGRIFNTYGPRMQVNDGRVVSNFIVQALKNEALTIFGSGNQTRSFCYVDDLIEGILGFVGSDQDIGPVNIGNPNEISILELADKICSLIGSRSKIILKPLPEDDPVKRNPEINKIKGLTGWEPKVPLDDGLRETIYYFRKMLD